MNRRYRIYAGAIALLAAINVARWVLHGETKAQSAPPQTLLAEDFRLHMDTPDKSGSGRDLFAPAGGAGRWGYVAGGARRRHGGSRLVVAKKVVPQPASAVDAAQLMAQNGLNRLRLLGVVFHGGKRQAYLGQDKENCIAAAGDTVFGQYIVDEVTVDAVQLRDTTTNITRRIPLSGK